MEYPDGGYRMQRCAWCENGLVDFDTMKMWFRWQRILRHNIRAGRCPASALQPVDRISD